MTIPLGAAGYLQPPAEVFIVHQVNAIVGGTNEP